MAVNKVFIGTEYQVGLAGVLEADSVFSSEILKDHPDFEYMGSTIEIPKLSFNIGMEDNDASGTSGATPGSDASTMIEVGVRRLDGVIDIESGEWQKHEKLGTAAERDVRLARSFAAKSAVKLLTAVMTALATIDTVDSTKVKDITGATETADQALGTMSGKAAKAIILTVRGYHGVYATQVKYIIAHSNVVTVFETMANDAGVHYYTQRSPRGFLLVEGAELLPCDIGTKSGTTYSTYFIRPEALAFGQAVLDTYSAENELDGDEDTGSIKVSTRATDADGTESYRFTLKTYYFMHLYSHTDGAPGGCQPAQEQGVTCACS